VRHRPQRAATEDLSQTAFVETVGATTTRYVARSAQGGRSTTNSQDQYRQSPGTNSSNSSGDSTQQGYASSSVEYASRTDGAESSSSESGTTAAKSQSSAASSGAGSSRDGQTTRASGTASRSGQGRTETSGSSTSRTSQNGATTFTTSSGSGRSNVQQDSGGSSRSDASGIAHGNSTLASQRSGQSKSQGSTATSNYAAGATGGLSRTVSHGTQQGSASESTGGELRLAREGASSDSQLDEAFVSTSSGQSSQYDLNWAPGLVTYADVTRSDSSGGKDSYSGELSEGRDGRSATSGDATSSGKHQFTVNFTTGEHHSVQTAGFPLARYVTSTGNTDGGSTASNSVTSRSDHDAYRHTSKPSITTNQQGETVTRSGSQGVAVGANQTEFYRESAVRTESSDGSTSRSGTIRTGSDGAEQISDAQETADGGSQDTLQVDTWRNTVHNSGESTRYHRQDESRRQSQQSASGGSQTRKLDWHSNFTARGGTSGAVDTIHEEGSASETFTVSSGGGQPRQTLKLRGNSTFESHSVQTYDQGQSGTVGPSAYQAFVTSVDTVLYKSDSSSYRGSHTVDPQGRQVGGTLTASSSSSRMVGTEKVIGLPVSQQGQGDSHEGTVSDLKGTRSSASEQGSYGYQSTEAGGTLQARGTYTTRVTTGPEIELDATVKSQRTDGSDVTHTKQKKTDTYTLTTKGQYGGARPSTPTFEESRTDKFVESIDSNGTSGETSTEYHRTLTSNREYHDDGSTTHTVTDKGSQTTRPGSDDPEPDEGCTSTAEEDHCVWDTVTPNYTPATTPLQTPDDPLAGLTPEQIAALSNQEVETLLAGLPADEIGQEDVIYALPDAQRRAVNLRLMQFYNQTQAGAVSTGGENDAASVAAATAGGLAFGAGDVITDSLPIVSQYRNGMAILTSVDPYTGEEVRGWQKGLAAVGLIPVLGTIFKRSARAVRAADDLADAASQLARHADDAAEAVADTAKRGAFVAPQSVAGKGGIYEFPDQAAGGKPYVGQSGNISDRLQQHAASGRLKPGTEATTPVPGGKAAREIAEHKRIQELTGGQRAKVSEAVSNKIDPIGPKRRPDLGLPEPLD
jgi:hypothetical protein